MAAPKLNKAVEIISAGLKAASSSGKKKKKDEPEEESGLIKLTKSIGGIVKARQAEQQRKIAEAAKGTAKAQGLKLSRKSGGGARRGF